MTCLSKLSGLIVLLILVGGCRGFPEENTLDLLREFSTARQSFLVIGPGAAGRPAFRSFLGAGLRPDLDGDWARAETDAVVPAFGFFLYESRPLTLLAKGLSSTPKEVGFRCGDKLIGSARIGSQLTEVRLDIPAKNLIPGLNTISIEGAHKVLWHDFQVRPTGSGLSIETRQPLGPMLSDDNLSLLLPFAGSVDFALDSPGQAELDFRVEVWQQPGAPALDSSHLRVTARILGKGSKVPLLEKTWNGTGARRWALPPGLGPFALQLRSSLDGETPLPGQVGVKLVTPRVLRSGLPSPPAKAARTEYGPAPALPLDNPPNVVLYLVDTLRADRLSLYGYPYPTSPRLSALAADAVTFQNAMAESSWTKPTVASTMTSKEPEQHGVVDFNDKLDERFVTLAEVLGAAGYQTLGVIANPLLNNRFGFAQGFDQYVSLPVTEKATVLNVSAFKMLGARDKGRPFLLYLQPLDPHLPYDPPAPFQAQAMAWRGVLKPPGASYPLLPSADRGGFERLTRHLYAQAADGLPPDVPESTLDLVRALYDGEVASTDAAFGQLIDWLKKNGLYDNTIIVFTSDHGEELIDRNWLGHLDTLYQELVWVPLVIKFPDSRWAGEHAREIWQQIDIVPTVLAAAGLAPLVGADGLAFPAARAQVQRRAGFFQVRAGSDAVDAGQTVAPFLELGSGLRQGPWKLIHQTSSVKPTLVRGLFNLDEDPGETTNLILEHPVLALGLETELARRNIVSRGGSPASKGAAEETRAILQSLQYLR